MNSDWLNIEVLEDYLDGKLDGKAMHRIEREALEDPFIAQALAGLSQSPKRSSTAVSLLQKQLYDRIAQQEVVKKETVFTWQRLSVAAAAAVMFISVSIIFFMRDEERREQQAKVNNRPKTVEVNLAPSPPVVDSIKGEQYVADKTAKVTGPVGVAKISPAREAHPAPIRSVYAGTAGMKAAVVDTLTGIGGVLPSTAAPVGGWANLDSYLADHNKFSKDSNLQMFVELSFLIDSSGTPVDIQVTKGAGVEMNAEAIRLIKEGPKWEQPDKAGNRITYTVAF